MSLEFRGLKINHKNVSMLCIHVCLLDLIRLVVPIITEHQVFLDKPMLLFLYPDHNERNASTWSFTRNFETTISISYECSANGVLEIQNRTACHK